MTVRLDLTDQTSVEDAARQVTATFGGVDVLVNNAVAWSGFPEPGELFETAPVQRMRAGVEANLLGHYLMTRAVVGSMRRHGWGRVVHISTGLVEDGLPGSSAYVTAKAGLHGLIRTMSRELASAGILTNLVMAGFVAGDRRIPAEILTTTAAAAATGRTTTATEVANVVVFLCSEANGHSPGSSSARTATSSRRTESVLGACLALSYRAVSRRRLAALSSVAGQHQVRLDTARHERDLSDTP
jgi:3-oxoacyl-[acyl-carrier protein] reductase